MSDAFSAFDLSGKTALVTGGASGIGYNMTRALLRSGAKVLMAARRENILEQAAVKLAAESHAGEVLYHPVDLGDRRSVQTLTEYAIDAMGGVDIFVGNAGLGIYEPVEKIADHAIDQMFQVNVSANIELVRAFLPEMRKRKWGRIIFSSSAASCRSGAQHGMGVYSAVKAALNAFARTAAMEAGHDGVTVNSLILGTFVTDFMEDALAKIKVAQGPAAAQSVIDSVANMTALGRLARCHEIEGIIQFLASDAGGYVTATSLAFDGGLTSMLLPNPPPADLPRPPAGY